MRHYISTQGYRGRLRPTVWAAGLVEQLSSQPGGLALALGVFAVRGALPMGGARVGMALGAAGGAAGGLALHFHCPIAVPAHVMLGHAVPVLIAALVGALLIPPLAER